MEGWLCRCNSWTVWPPRSSVQSTRILRRSGSCDGRICNESLPHLTERNAEHAETADHAEHFSVFSKQIHHGGHRGHGEVTRRRVAAAATSCLCELSELCVLPSCLWLIFVCF